MIHVCVSKLALKCARSSGMNPNIKYDRTVCEMEQTSVMLETEKQKKYR
jgi:hypothetical protein